MSQDQATNLRLPTGVSPLPRSRGGRRFLAKIRHKGVEVHLGIYESAGLAGFAFNVASEAIGRGSRPPNQIPDGEQPDAEGVWRITSRVRRRLGLDPPARKVEEVPPDPEALLILFEVTVVGFWRDQAARSDAGEGVDAASRRLAEAARLVFWSPSSGHPTPSEAIARLVARRVDQAFRRADVTRAILDDDGDEGWRVARWLALPDVHPLGRGFRDEVRFLYPELFEDKPGHASSPSGVPHWADVLGVDPPFSVAKIREAYRARSKSAHPDAGGSHVDFVRLRAAYEEARDYCRIMGI
jgi:hypothetical protein